MENPRETAMPPSPKEAYALRRTLILERMDSVNNLKIALDGSIRLSPLTLTGAEIEQTTANIDKLRDAIEVKGIAEISNNITEYASKLPPEQIEALIQSRNQSLSGGNLSHGE